MTNARRVAAVWILYGMPWPAPAEEVKYSTPHFELIHDVASQEAALIAKILEATYDAVAAFLKELNLPLRPLQQKLPVRLLSELFVFEREVTATGHSAEGIVGLFVPESNVTLLLRPESIPTIAALNRELARSSGHDVAAIQAQRDVLVERIRRLTIAHETAHQLLFNLGPLDSAARQPAWLVEGLACLFEPTSPTADYRRKDLPKDLTVTKLRDVISAASLNGPDAAEDYAVAYVLVDHLRRISPNALGQLMLLRGPLQLADFERVAGPIDASIVAALQRAPRTGEPGK